MQSYFKFLSRNKLYTAIQAAGLAVSLAFVIIIGCYAWEQYEVTREHPDRERVYALGMPDHYGLTSGFRDVAAQRIPEIEAISHIATGSSCYVKAAGDEDYALASVLAVDGAFFDLFPQYGLLDGSAETLRTNSCILVSESFAHAHGIRTGDAVDCAGDPYTVGGIFADFRRTLMPRTDMLVPEECDLNLCRDNAPFDGFGNHIPFVRLRKGTDFGEFMAKIEVLCKEIYPSVYGHLFLEYVQATRIDEIFFAPDSGKQFNHGDIKTLRMLILVGILLLISAVFNYINLNTALTGKRAREMAARRLLGASRAEIVGKYIGESLLFTAVCFGAALLLATGFAPVMDRLLNNPYITVRVLFSPVTVAGFAATVAVVGCLSGIIPAMLAAKYRPIDVMKGSFRMASRMTFSKLFIVLQNALAVFLIAMALVMEAQYVCSLNRPMHIDGQNKFYLTLGAGIGVERHRMLSDALRALPCVETIGRTQGAPGFQTGGQFSRTRDGNEILYRTYKMDSTAFAMFRFEKVRDYGTPPAGGVWFGERAFAATGFDDDSHEIEVLRQRMTHADHTAGTIRDFPVNASNMGEEDYLLVLTLSDAQMDGMWWYNYILSTRGDKAEARRQIMETYGRWCTEQFGLWMEPQSADFVDDNYRRALEPARNNMRLMELFMLLAILISMLGLVAMSTYYAGENARNIAIRKVFGGTVGSETWLSVRSYMVQVGAACLIALPVAVWAARRYLESFIVRIERYGWIFVAAAAVSIAIAFVSVFWQTWRAARTNPATELKKE